MPRKLFLNLPVRDLEKSMAFFKGLGFTFNPQFTDHTAACMIIGEDNYVMLLTHAKFAEFTPRRICDSTQSTEVLIALDCQDRAEVDRMVAQALANGGTTYHEPRDYGFMYQHGFQDLDGHIWEVFYMDPNHVQ
jgi:predicted lactoylglutathione lyase